MIRKEMMLKAKEAQSAEELMALAKENGMEMTEESAAAYLEAMHKSGELADEELSNVAGGWCYNDGRPVITIGEQHEECFVCNYCGKSRDDLTRKPLGWHHVCLSGKENLIGCANCKYCIYEKGLWLCDNPKNRK